MGQFLRGQRGFTFTILPLPIFCVDLFDKLTNKDLIAVGFTLCDLSNLLVHLKTPNDSKIGIHFLLYSVVSETIRNLSN